MIGIEKICGRVLVVCAIMQYGYSQIVRTWGEECLSNEQCTDNSLICKAGDNNDIKTCICDKFHRWNTTLLACVPQYNLTDMLDFLQQQYDHHGIIQRDADRVFNGALYSGYVVIFVGCLCVLSVLGFCCYIRKKDGDLHDHVKKLKRERLHREESRKITTRQIPA